MVNMNELNVYSRTMPLFREQRYLLGKCVTCNKNYLPFNLLHLRLSHKKKVKLTAPLFDSQDKAEAWSRKNNYKTYGVSDCMVLPAQLIHMQPEE